GRDWVAAAAVLVSSRRCRGRHVILTSRYDKAMDTPVSLQAERDRAGHRSGAGALIVGGAHGSLALARSLGRRGIAVWFVTDDHPIAKHSRYIRRSFAWPGPNHDGAIDFLLALAARYRLQGWVLIAAGDAELRLLSQRRADLASTFRVTVPPWETVRW